MIALQSVEKRYAGKRVLAPTTLTVPAHTCLCLLGSSGCGKSTILRLVLGLIAPDAGRVLVDGEPVTAASARELGWAEPRVRARLADLLALVRLDASTLSRYPGELSGGQRQRVGIMRALMLDPEILLLDEPMGALDPLVRRKLQDDLKRIFAERSRTVLLVTHDVGEAAYLGDEVALMRDGTIVQRGPMAALAETPADPFVEEFLRAQRAPGPDTWRAAS
jgi:osmoprotectant transport system ATP-binding protein